MNQKTDKIVRKRYEILCDLYYDYIYRCALIYAQDRHIAEECTHKVIMKIAENPKYIRDLEVTSCKAYLYRCVVNTVNDEQKDKNRQTLMGLTGELIYENQSYNDDFTDLKGEYGFGEEMDDHFKSLNEKSVQAISMRYGAQMKISEIAEETGEKENTIVRRLGRARLKLMALILEKEGQDDDE